MVCATSGNEFNDLKVCLLSLCVSGISCKSGAEYDQYYSAVENGEEFGLVFELTIKLTWCNREVTSCH